MADWAKIRFYWKSMLAAEGSLLAASSSFDGTSAESIRSMLETSRWQAAGAAGPHYITFDAGAGVASAADYLAAAGHNLWTAGAAVTLQYSSDGISYLDAFEPFVPSSDRAFAREFPSPGAFRFWRLRLDGTSVAPFIYIAAWGEKTELDYASSSFDPHAQEAVSIVNQSQGGYIAGVHSRFVERSMTIRFEDASDALYRKVSEWWEGSSGRNFFVAWEPSNHPEDVFLMRPDARFSNPLKAGGAARDMEISLTGRKE